MATRLGDGVRVRETRAGDRMRGRALSRSAPFTAQVNRSIVAAMILVSLITVALFALTGFNRLVQQTQESALRVAQSVAETPSVREAAEAESNRATPSTDAELVAGTVDDYARSVEQRTGALFVVVTDDTGRRLAHPNDDEIGDPVSTSPEAALAGEETVSWERGTLGDSARAKVPVYGLADPARVVGEVSVGLPPTEVWSTVLADALPVGLSTALALGVGAVLAAFITRRLRATTLGLEPEELRSLVQDQQAVLQGVDDGVVGLSPDGTVTVCNDRAAELLGIRLPDAVGRGFGDVVADAGVRDRVAGAASTALGEPLLVGGHLLYVDVHEVDRDGRSLGRVVIVRDVTDVEDLNRRLSAVGTLAGALREQRHEFANRIHVVSGLVRSGEVQQALEYLDGIAGHGPVRFPVENAQLVREPYLQAFLGAKAAEAEARGVALRVGPDADVVGSLVHPEDVTTVLGNLVDNGIDAAARSARVPRWVEVEALRHGAELHLSVMDSGDGAGATSAGAAAVVSAVSSAGSADAVDPAGPAGPVDLIDAAGPAGSVDPVGSVDPAGSVHGHGIGLRLSADVARRHGGRLWLAMAGASDHGAVFCAVLDDQFEKEDGS